jgi:uncharacterized repeat protein (TIGR01451 family)
MFSKQTRRVLLAGAAIAASTVSGTALAQTGTPTPTPTAQTPAGREITNQATATYSVNGTAATTKSNISTFKVDRKVNLTLVSEQNANVQVNLGQQDAYLAFRLTNLTNGTQDFLLDPDQSTVPAGVLLGTDDFNVDRLRAFVDADGDGKFDPNIDKATYVDELAANASVVVFLVGDVPTTGNPNLAFGSMHVTVAAGDAPGTQGAVLAQTTLNVVNQDNEVDVVFADSAKVGDPARDGQARAYAAFEIGTRTVALTVEKSSRVISDGVSDANPKALPGAVVEYCLVVRNSTALVPASNVTLTDVIPANTAYVPGSIQVGALSGVSQCILPGSGEDDDTDDAAEIDPYRGYGSGELPRHRQVTLPPRSRKRNPAWRPHAGTRSPYACDPTHPPLVRSPFRRPSGAWRRACAAGRSDHQHGHAFLDRRRCPADRVVQHRFPRRDARQASHQARVPPVAARLRVVRHGLRHVWRQASLHPCPYRGRYPGRGAEAGLLRPQDAAHSGAGRAR